MGFSRFSGGSRCFDGGTCDIVRRTLDPASGRCDSNWIYRGHTQISDGATTGGIRLQRDPIYECVAASALDEDGRVAQRGSSGNMLPVVLQFGNLITYAAELMPSTRNYYLLQLVSEQKHHST